MTTSLSKSVNTIPFQSFEKHKKKAKLTIFFHFFVIIMPYIKQYFRYFSTFEERVLTLLLLQQQFENLKLGRNLRRKKIHNRNSNKNIYKDSVFKKIFWINEHKIKRHLRSEESNKTYLDNLLHNLQMSQCEGRWFGA